MFHTPLMESLAGQSGTWMWTIYRNFAASDFTFFFIQIINSNIQKMAAFNAHNKDRVSVPHLGSGWL